MRNSPSPGHAVLFDDQCPLCASQMRILARLDWFKAFRLLPLSDPQAAVLAPTLRRDDLLEAIHCVTTSGRIHRGVLGLRFVGLRVPLLVPMALFLWIPGVLWVAERIYLQVSRNRYFLSRLFGCKEACSITPARDRETDATQFRRPK